MEQRVNIKFCYKLGKTATETHEMLVRVYGTEAVSRKCVYDWFKAFVTGRNQLRMSHVRVGRRQQFCDRFLQRPLLTVARIFMNVAKSVLWRTAIILKANKVNLFVSSVLFVFWYHSPNFLARRPFWGFYYSGIWCCVACNVTHHDVSNERSAFIFNAL